MEIIQEILVFIAFGIALGYMITKFVYKPKFLVFDKKPGKDCGDGCDTCH